MGKLLDSELAEKAFSPEVVEVYANGTQLTHEYTNSRKDSSGGEIDFNEAVNLINHVGTGVRAWYESKTGQIFNNLSLGDFDTSVREQYWNNPDFVRACKIIGLEKDVIRDINLPWFNESLAGEIDYSKTPGSAHVVFGSMHSFETLLTRMGYNMPVKSTSVDGVIMAAPDAQSAEGYIVLGVRGGHSFRNTYHVIGAGSLRATEAFKRGEESMQDVWEREEFRPEIGNIPAENVKIRPHAKTQDWLLNRGNTTYLFEAKTDLTRDQITDIWRTSEAHDKQEHSELVFVPANPKSINDFIATNYRGNVANRQDRSSSERLLLPPAALALISVSGMSPQQLGEHYREGLH